MLLCHAGPEFETQEQHVLMIMAWQRTSGLPPIHSCICLPYVRQVLVLQMSDGSITDTGNDIQLRTMQCACKDNLMFCQRPCMILEDRTYLE